MTTGSTRGNAATRPFSEFAPVEASDNARRVVGLRSSSTPELVSFASIFSLDSHPAANLTPPFSRWREPARRAAPACRRVPVGCNGLLGVALVASTTEISLPDAREPNHRDPPALAKRPVLRWLAPPSE